MNGGERGPNDGLCWFHYPLQGLAVWVVAFAIPDSDAASQDTLYGSSVEGGHDGWEGRLALFR